MSPPSSATAAAPARRARPQSSAAPASRPATRRPHLRLAPEVTRRRRRARVAVWGATLLSVASMFVLVGFHVVAAQQAFQSDRLQQDRAVQERRYERLREEVATLSAPNVVVAAAQRLGMVPALHVEAIEVPPAAPSGPKQDQTAETLGNSWDEAKRHLGADP